MEDISKKTLDLIKERNIHPKPRWQFLLKNSVIWFFFAVSVVLGSLSFSTALFLVNDYDLPGIVGTDPANFQHIVSSLPYFWLAFIVLFLLLAFYNFKHTKEGYRHRTGLIMVLSIALSIVLGMGFYYAGAGTRIDSAFAQGMPFYNRMVCHQSEFWMNADKGFLAGEILSPGNAKDFAFRDSGGLNWRVRSENARWHHGLVPMPGLRIRMIGRAEGDIFTARDIMPFAPPRERIGPAGGCGMAGCSR